MTPKYDSDPIETRNRTMAIAIGVRISALEDFVSTLVNQYLRKGKQLWWRHWILKWQQNMKILTLSVVIHVQLSLWWCHRNSGSGIIQRIKSHASASSKNAVFQQLTKFPKFNQFKLCKNNTGWRLMKLAYGIMKFCLFPYFSSNIESRKSRKHFKLFHAIKLTS